VNCKLRDEVNVTGMKFEVFMVVTVKVAVFWDLTPRKLTETYQCYGRPVASIFMAEDGYNSLLQNVG
jgi:hypothetical protein